MFLHLDSGIEREIGALQIEVCEELPNYPHLLFLRFGVISDVIYNCVRKRSLLPR
jgi:hypothetical protein